MKRKTIVIGDIHGRVEIVEEALDSPHSLIFLGDFLDSYDRSVEDQVKALALVLDAMDADDGRSVVSVMGNHERSYLFNDERCSGWKYEIQTYVEHFKHRMKKCLKPYHHINGFYISHAGVSEELLERNSQSFYDYLDAGNFLGAGYSRGGPNPVGGLYWCDWFKEFKPVPGVPQIVGHSGYRPRGYEGLGILKKGEYSYNVDCLDHKREFLDITNGINEVKICEGFD